MINVTVGDYVFHKAVLVSSTDTPRKVLEDSGTDYTNGTPQLDGGFLNPGDLDKAFVDLGVPDYGRCFLMVLRKLDGMA